MCVKVSLRSTMRLSPGGPQWRPVHQLILALPHFLTPRLGVLPLPELYPRIGSGCPLSPDSLKPIYCCPALSPASCWEQDAGCRMQDGPGCRMQDQSGPTVFSALSLFPSAREISSVRVRMLRSYYLITYLYFCHIRC